MPDIFQFLAANGIEYQRFDHPPVYTVEDVHRLTPNLPGAKTKNLFICEDKKKRHFLVVVPADKRVDLKALPEALQSRRVRFGSPDRLMTYLGIEPGSVSLLAIFHDVESHAVEVVIDEQLWQSDAFQFHPLINTVTLTIDKNGIERFLAATGHDFKVAKVPESTL